MSAREPVKVAKNIQISKRLQVLAGMVTPGNVVADVGCDHGFLSIYLVQNGISPRVIATDVRKGPLSAAKAHVTEFGLEHYIETRLSDGLAQYKPGEADTMVCAGMGGPLMQRILLGNKNVTETFRELVLQPQSELAEFRVFLRNHGFAVQEENILCEDGKYYFFFRVASLKSQIPKGEDENQRLWDKYGEKLLKNRHPVLKEYLEKGVLGTLSVKEQLLQHLEMSENKERIRERLQENEEELLDLNRALTMFDEEV